MQKNNKKNKNRRKTIKSRIASNQFPSRMINRNSGPHNDMTDYRHRAPDFVRKHMRKSNIILILIQALSFWFNTMSDKHVISRWIR